jgi:hypothetical protein
MSSQRDPREFLSLIPFVLLAIVLFLPVFSGTSGFSYITDIYSLITGQSNPGNLTGYFPLLVPLIIYLAALVMSFFAMRIKKAMLITGVLCLVWFVAFVSIGFIPMTCSQFQNVSPAGTCATVYSSFYSFSAFGPAAYVILASGLIAIAYFLFTRKSKAST